MRGIERVNILAAIAIVAVFLALHTPLADPMRIAVDSQIARLKSGQTAADKFDYNFLRFRAGRYGETALLALTTDANSSVAERARQALNPASRTVAIPRPAPPPAAKRVANVTVVHPKGGELPRSLLEQDWSGHVQQWQLPRCLVADAKCEAVLADIDGDGTDEVLLLPVPAGQAAAFKVDGGRWRYLGGLANFNCHGVRAAIGAGQIGIVTPAFREIVAGGQRLSVLPSCNP